MTTSTMPNSPAAADMEQEVVITRVFDAPREMVFAAWTEAKQLERWWGPKGFTNPVCECDARVSGKWHIVMRQWTGQEYPCGGVYREVVPPERLAFTNNATDEAGNVVIEGYTQVDFAEHEGGKTLLTLTTRAKVFDEKMLAALAGMHAGWSQSLDKLAALLPATAPTPSPAHESELVITRIFDADRSLVFAAWTEPEHLAQWWGPKGSEWVSATLDLRPGGLFLYCMRAPQGLEMWGKFTYREISAPQRLVFISAFADHDGNTIRAPFSQEWPLEVLNTVNFEERSGSTIVTLRAKPIDATATEQSTFAAMKNSMQQGFAGTFDQLEEYLSKR